MELGNNFINESIWNLALYSSKYRDLDPTVIANAQELLISYISLVEKLSFKAYMGITIVIARVSHSKGEKLFQIAERKFSQHKSHRRIWLLIILLGYAFAILQTIFYTYSMLQPENLKIL